MTAPPVLRSSRISNASPLAVLLGLLLLPVALVGPNVTEVAYAAVVLAVGLTILWRPAEPPIPLLIFGYQWIQAAMGPIYGNLSGLALNDLSRNLGEHNLAAWLELTGVLCLALGMRWAIGNRDFDLHRRVIAFVGSRPLGFWFRIYLTASIFGALCATFAYSAGGLVQPLLSLSQIKWAGYILLTFSAFAIRGNPKGIWIAVTLFEFVLSVGGFFSTFKDIFFYAALGLVGSGYRFRAPQLIIFTALASLLLPLGVVWSAVKIPYRDFVNGRTLQQSVNAGYTERIGYLGTLIGNLDRPALAEGLDTLARRVMYFEFFGATIGNVPENVPHTGGAIWGRAIAASFMPRLIFTSKAPVHDSELTRQYSGIRVSSYEQGTSISMGYLAEAYIDFGAVLMFVPILLLGAGFGFIYRWLLSRSGRDGVIGAALSTFTLMPANAIETSVLKMIPAVLLCVVACLIIFKFIAPLIWGVSQPPTAAAAHKPRLAGG